MWKLHKKLSSKVERENSLRIFNILIFFSSKYGNENVKRELIFFYIVEGQYNSF